MASKRAPYAFVLQRCRSFARKSFSSKYLIWTNTITSGVLLCVGDAIEQKVELSRGLAKTYDYRRTGNDAIALKSMK